MAREVNAEDKIRFNVAKEPSETSKVPSDMSKANM